PTLQRIPRKSATAQEFRKSNLGQLLDIISRFLLRQNLILLPLLRYLPLRLLLHPRPLLRKILGLNLLPLLFPNIQMLSRLPHSLRLEGHLDRGQSLLLGWEFRFWLSHLWLRLRWLR